MEPQAKKTALRMISNGMYILTSAHGGNVGSCTVTWVSQKSFNPPLVTVSVKKDSVTHAVIEKSGAFAIHILGKGQKDMAATFFKHSEPKDGAIAGYAFKPGATGSPILEACPAYFECKVAGRSDLGDHTTFVGEVVEAGVRSSEKPLTVADTPWQYGG